MEETKKNVNAPELPYLSPQIIREIKEGFDQLKIEPKDYPGNREFCKQFKKVGLLQYEGIIFSASNTSSAFSK